MRCSSSGRISDFHSEGRGSIPLRRANITYNIRDIVHNIFYGGR